MIGIIEEKMGGIPELESRLLDGVDLDLRDCKTRPQVNKILKEVSKACDAEKRTIQKMLTSGNFTKQDLRKFNYDLHKEISYLVEEQDSMPLTENDYLEAMSDVIFSLREIANVAGCLIDSDIIVRRESARQTVGATI